MSTLKSLWKRGSLGILLPSLWGIGGFNVQLSQAITPLNPELKIGIVQRFGTKGSDKLTLKSTDGKLNLKFPISGGLKTETVNQVKLEIKMKPLVQPELEERVVLSNHRSFESAEYSANQWKQKGIEVEIAQPERWQVWAKRDVYQTPLLRRFLLENLQSQGFNDVVLESQVRTSKPQVFWEIAGKKYEDNPLEIRSQNQLIEVVVERESQDSDPKKPKKVNIENRIYGGSLKLQPNAYGTYTLVNIVPIETYLRGVVPFEIGASSPHMSQQAQAILARTYALRNLRRFAIDNYELCADVNCQVYYGLKETYPTTDRAIQETRGLVLTYQDQLVDALYSAASGGITSSFNEVWLGEDRPYLKAVIDSPEPLWNLDQTPLDQEENFRKFMRLRKRFNEEGSRVFRWSESTTLKEMTDFLKTYLHRRKSPLTHSFKTIKKVNIVERSRSGRVLKMTVETDNKVITIERDEIRNAFAPPISTLFYLEPIYEPNQTLKGYTFIGGGFGHGVGMSQIGSYNLAQLGWNSQRILQFYFPGTTLKLLTDSRMFRNEK